MQDSFPDLQGILGMRLGHDCNVPYPNLLQFEQDSETARPAEGDTWEPGHSEEDTGQGATLQPPSVGRFNILQ